MTSAALTIRERSAELAKGLELARPRLEAVIPAGMGLTVARQVGIVMDACGRQPKLFECHLPSIVRCVLESSELGLELGSLIGEAYLVPFWNSKQRRKECSLIAGYKGLIKLALGSPRIERIEARLVREGDAFREELGTEPKLFHEPSGPAGDRPVTHAYAVAFYSSGRTSFEVMYRTELDAIRERSKSRDRDNRLVGPWVTDEGEMMKKTPVRRLCKRLELSPLLRRGIELDDLNALRRGEITSMPVADEGKRAEDFAAVVDAQFEDDT